MTNETGVQATSERLIDAGAFAVNDGVDTPWGDRNRGCALQTGCN